MKIASIVGARPQFIKLAPVDKALRERHDHIIIHTGQHYDRQMSAAFFEQLEIAHPRINLNTGPGSHHRQTGEMLAKIGDALEKDPPDLVLVYGDTNSTLAGALAAVKLHIPVCHVEAGYRSCDLSMPEEVNRLVVDKIAQLLMAPTEDAVDNLLSEGVDPERIFFTGNIMAESLINCLELAKKSTILETFGLQPGKYGVLTIHRPENTSDPARLRNILEGLISARFPLIFPVHPRTAKALDDPLTAKLLKKSSIVPAPPLNYLDFMKLHADSRLMVTDSGGIQEEALLLRVPCLTLRYNTERTLTIKLGGNKLVGAEPDSIARGLADPPFPWRGQTPPRWDNRVAGRMLDTLENHRELLRIERPQAYFTTVR